MSLPALLIVFCLAGFCADGSHPYSITTLHADLQHEKIVLTIGTNAEDLMYFHRMEFDSLFRIPAEKLRAAAATHGKTLQSGIYILDEHKKQLPAILTSLDFSSLAGKESIDVMSLLKYPLRYTLEFKLDEFIELLEFHQELGTVGLPAVSFLTITRNGNTLAQNIELTKGRPFIMVRDAISLRIPDRNTFMVSYLTLSDTRVVHELTIPLEILESFVSTDDKAEPEAGMKLIRDFISESSAVTINGTVIQPEITALVTGTGSAPGSSMANIRIEYSLAELPNEVNISWENFNWRMRWFKSIIDAFGEKGEFNFSRFQPKLNIQRKIKLQDE